MSESKQILAFLREGNFAHPGEIEAIELAMKPIAKNPNQWLLDVGCGLGGTANYLEENGWGNIVALDIDNEVIREAKHHYPDITFLNCDVMKAQAFLPDIKFNVIYCFSSFFCFSEQQESLLSLSKSADSGCELVIFDYSRLTENSLANPFHHPKASFKPIYLKEFKDILTSSGWIYKNSIDITDQFKRWYNQLLAQFNSKQSDLIKQFDKELCSAMYEGYRRLLDEIEAKKIGGIIVYATRKANN